MKGKITDSLKPPLTKTPSEVGYWKLNEMPESGECLKEKHQYLNFWRKEIGNYANEQSQNGKGEYRIDEIMYAKGGYYKCVHMRTRRRGLKNRS